ncbi:MAG: tetratricopeptide repeat protein, partial [Gemmatimonadota bacterium]|nr:tetratricopeptide repeat protein [Gemmatimonadota bacterium]
MTRALLLPLALVSCAQSGQSPSEESAARPSAAAEVQAAADALDAGRPWRATTILVPVLADPRRRTPEAVLLAARAATGWSGWSDVDRLLRNEPWIDTAFAGHGRALLARAAFERRDDSGTVRDARAAIGAALDASERGARLALLARALERLDERDSARVTYEQAAAALPAAADWLRLRAAGVTTDTAARAAVYAGLTIPAARARAPWVEAQVRERTGDLTGAAARYEALGATMTAARVRLAATSDPAARQLIRSELVATIERRPGSSDARAAVDIATQAFSLTPSEELAVARSAAKSGPASRAAAGFARAFAGGVGTGEDRYSYGMVLMQLGRNADAAQQLNLVRSGPVVPDASYQRARALLRTSRGDLAAAILERVVRSYPSSVEAASAALFLLGDLATDRGQDEHARALFRRVGHAYPTSNIAGAARFRAALIAFVGGDHRAAALEFDTLATKYDRSADAQAASYWSGRAWASAGDTMAAQTRWRAARHREPLSYYALLSARRLGADFSTLPEPADTVAVPPDVTKVLERAALLETLGLELEARHEYDRLAADTDGST